MQNTLNRVLALLLAMLVVCSNSSMETVAIDTGMEVIEKVVDSTDSTDTAKENMPFIVGEDVSKRGENEKHFRMSDGSYVMAQYNSPVHYEEEGAWKAIDNTLQEGEETEDGKSEQSADVYENKKNTFNVKFAKKSNSNFLLKIKQDNMSVSWSVESPKKNKVIGQATNNSKESDDPMSVRNLTSEMLYENVIDDTDLQYIVTPTGVKENIIIKKKQDAYQYTFGLRVKNVTMQLKDDGCIAVQDNDGKERFVIPAPYMYDASGTNSTEVHYELLSGNNDKKYTLSIIPDEKWINSVERQFPIVIDPVFVETGHDTIHDTVASYNSNISDLSPTILNIGWKDREVAALVHADLDILGKRIISAQLRMYYNIYAYAVNANSYVSNTQGMQVNAHRITGKWDEKWSSSYGLLNCNEIPAYDTVIGDYAITDGEAAYGNGLIEFDITYMAQQWADGVANWGVMLKANNPQSGNVIGLLDSDHPAYDSYNPSSNNTPYMDPTFVINYRDAKGIEPQWTYTSMSGGRAATAYVNNYNGELTIINEDAGVDGNTMPLSVYHVYNDATRTWKTNYELFMMHETTSAKLKDNYPYYLTDMDGTEHYFYEKEGKYVDEDGLGYTLELVRGYDILYQIQDKDGTKMNFNWNGQLYYIEDSIGNLNYVAWTNGFTTIGEILDGAERSYGFTYHGGYINSISAPDGIVNFGLGASGRIDSVTYPGDTSASTIFTYNNSNQPIRITGLDGCYVEIEYTASSPCRVQKMSYKDASGVVLESYTFTYHHNMTVIADKDSYKTTYQFNSAGHTVGVVDQTTGMAQYYEFGMPGQTGTGVSAINKADQQGTQNKMLSSTQLQNSVDNYVANPSFNTSGGFKHYISLSQCNVNQMLCAGGADGKCTASGSVGYSMYLGRDSAGSQDMVYYYVPTLPSAGWYTFSMYYNTNGTVLTNGGAFLCVKDYTADGSSATRYESEPIIESKPKSTSYWNRISVPFYYSGTEVHLELISPKDCCGYLYVDCFQLEPGAVANTYNLLENSNLDRGTTGWTYGDIPTISREYGFLGRTGGQNMIKCYGDAKQKREFTQHVIVDGNVGDVFSFGGWSWVEGVGVSKYDNTDANKPTSGIKITYGASKKEVYLSFNTLYRGYQMIGDTFVLEEETNYIDFTFTYNYNVNRGYFCRGYLYKEQYGQTYDYDASGNVVSAQDEVESQATFAYHNNNLSKLLNPSGSRYFYSYNQDTRVLNHALSSSEQQMSFTYDEWGNPLTTEVKHAPIVQQLEYGKKYYIINAHSGNVLDADGNDNNVVNHNWEPGNEAQMWKILETSTEGVYKAESVKYGRMLDVASPYLASGEGELMQTCPSNNSAAQKFTNRLNSDGSSVIMSTWPGVESCIDGQPGDSTDTSNSTPVKREQCDAKKESQKWYFVEVMENDADKKIKTSATYTENGNYQATVTDALGNVTIYNTNTANGQLNSATDAKGNAVSYTYDSKNRLKTVQGGNTTNEYIYDEADRLSGIKYNNGFGQYNFGYDSFSRCTNVKVGNRTLASYVYNDQNLLSTLTYGNGVSVNYLYDNHLERLASKYYNSDTTKNVRYFYDVQGRLAMTRDMFSDTTSEIVYDLSGRAVEYIQRQGLAATEGTEQVSLYNQYEDKTNRIIRQDARVLGQQLSTVITYGNGAQGQILDLVYGVTESLNGVNLFGLNYTYDALGRMSTREISEGITTTYSYVDGEDNTTSTLLAGVDNGGDAWTYEYDAIGNITKVYRNGELRQSYEYDRLNQLTRANDKDTDATYCYSYDNAGNILQKSSYPYTAGELTATASDIALYIYGDTDWKDLLTQYDGQTITYDEIGNPLTYRDGMSMTWQNGRQLAALNRAGTTISYQYNGDGIRTGKTVNGVETKYYLDDAGTILAEEKGGVMVRYLFDENGTRIGLILNGDSYFYDFNVQGDVVALRDAVGTVVVKYIYDAWGKLVAVTDATGTEITDNTHVGHMNSFRYRGYYYDAETGFYYLQSRYYDAEVGRFVNADDIIIIDSQPIIYNLYAYCENNPINYWDPSGHFGINKMFQQVLSVVINVVKIVCTIAETIRVKEELTTMPTPSEDITDSFKETLRENGETIKETTKKEGLVESSLLFYNNVRNGGEWDLKQFPEYQGTFTFNGIIIQGQDIGNINFGYTGKALGLPDSILLMGAGVAQIIAGTSSFSSIMASNGDDLRDQVFIIYGIRLYKEEN